MYRPLPLGLCCISLALLVAVAGEPILIVSWGQTKEKKQTCCNYPYARVWHMNGGACYYNHELNANVSLTYDHKFQIRPFHGKDSLCTTTNPNKYLLVEPWKCYTRQAIPGKYKEQYINPTPFAWYPNCVGTVAVSSLVTARQVTWAPYICNDSPDGNFGKPIYSLSWDCQTLSLYPPNGCADIGAYAPTGTPLATVPTGKNVTFTWSKKNYTAFWNVSTAASGRKDWDWTCAQPANSGARFSVVPPFWVLSVCCLAALCALLF
eukprot:TRINITY_DN68090_c1_g1_i1.p1 TRINITY_DN68090_c1_g1~~TRINITY_DN68090_c1_g1_i1.p1  ORF type:complete len:264 (+),score=19.26 TRINITY_DN68090_c1_g1_i1:59-850(+)